MDSTWTEVQSSGVCRAVTTMVLCRRPRSSGADKTAERRWPPLLLSVCLGRLWLTMWVSQAQPLRWECGWQEVEDLASCNSGHNNQNVSKCGYCL